MLVFVGGDDRRVDFRAIDELVVIGREKIGIDVFGEFFAKLLLNVAEPDPADAGVFPGEHRADSPNGAAADNRQSDF